MFFPNAPFGSSKVTKNLRKKAIELIGPYIKKVKESNEDLNQYISVWANSPHAGGFFFLHFFIFYFFLYFFFRYFKGKGLHRRRNNQ